MTCEEYEEQLSAFVDGEVPLPESVQVFAHLAECGDCRMFLGALMKVKKSTSEEEIAFPEELDEDIFAAVKQLRPVPVRYNLKQTGFLGRRLSWSFGVAATAVIFAFLVGGALGSFVGIRSVHEVVPTATVKYGEQGRQPAAVLIIYSLPEVQSTGIIPAKYERVQSDTIY